MQNDDMSSRPGLIQKYINTDYDNIREIGRNLKELLELLAFFRNWGGQSADLTLEFKQESPSEVWTIEHGMLKYPSVTISNNMHGEIQYVDKNTVEIIFSEAVSGFAFLN